MGTVRNDEIPRSLRNKIWYFRCPMCNMPKVVVTHLLYAECRGKWCRGKVYLPGSRIGEAEYLRLIGG